MNILECGLILGTLAITIFVEMHTQSHMVTILVAMGCAILALLVHILFRLQRSKRTDEFAKNSRKLQQSTSQVVKWLARNRYSEAKDFFSDLAKGSVVINDELQVQEILHFGYCEDPMVTQIQATSCGELDEWRDSPSWAKKDVPAMNKIAIDQGKKITRILILKQTEGWAEIESAAIANSGVGVNVKFALQDDLPAQAFNVASNCLIFSDAYRALYAIRAVHDGGRLTGIYLSTNTTKIRPITDAFKRIDTAAQDYDRENHSLLPKPKAEKSGAPGPDVS